MADLLLFLVLLLLLGGALSVASEELAPVFPHMRRAQAELKANHTSLRSVSVGNSHAVRGIDFAVLDLNGVHLSRAGGDFLESHFLVENALRVAPGIEIVLASASLGGFAIDNSMPLTAGRTERRRELYARVGSWRWIPGDFPLFVSGSMARLARTDHWRAPIRIALGLTAPARDDDDGDVDVDPTATALARHAVVRVAQHEELIADMLAHDPTIPTRAERALRGALRTADRHGALLVFYTAPLAPAYLERVDSAVRAAHARRMAAIGAESPCAVYFDFSDHPAFHTDPALFRNSDHLSDAGAQRFSALLAERIPEPLAACRRHAARPDAPAGRGTRTGATP